MIIGTTLLFRRGVSVIAAIILAGIVILTARKVEAPDLFRTEAYIWQVKGTPALSASMRENADIVHKWRVLAGRMDTHGRWWAAYPLWEILKEIEKPVIAVVRIEGQLRHFDRAVLLERVDSIVTEWHNRGVTLAGIEIDFDCATSRLNDYAAFLKALRAALPREQLSITALPTWLGSPNLENVLAEVDETVLQLHAVQNPTAGLFDPELAKIWMAKFAQKTKRPWYIALPTYGSRVQWDNLGRVAAIESEQSALMETKQSVNLFADPVDVQSFLKDLGHRQYRGLAGVAWFRLPTSDDRRAWSARTWRNVVQLKPLEQRFEVRVIPTDDSFLKDIFLENTGAVDAPAPSVVRLHGACSSGDGAGAYTFERYPENAILRRGAAKLFRSGEKYRIGWVRCATKGLTVELEP